jgi:hypothetical protein
MQPDGLLDYLSLWALYVATVAIVLLSIERGSGWEGEEFGELNQKRSHQ